MVGQNPGTIAGEFRCEWQWLPKRWGKKHRELDPSHPKKGVLVGDLRVTIAAIAFNTKPWSSMTTG